MVCRLLSACLGAALLIALNGSDRAAEPPARTVYEMLPAALPTPTLYQLHPTARSTLAGSLFFGVNPLLGMLPTAKILDAPGDHPQQVAGDDVFSDMPPRHVYGIWSSGGCSFEFGGGDWMKWIVSHWVAQRGAPPSEANEGYITPSIPSTLVADLSSVETPTDDPLVPIAEMLPMPREDETAATADGITCPWLRQQAANRHACPSADPCIERGVLENLERLQEADHLLEVAKDFARSGCIGAALECCAIAQEMCPGSPCARRAAELMLDLYVSQCERVIPSYLREATKDESREDARSSIEKRLNSRVNLNVTNTPLRQILDDLRGLAEINIFVDEPALKEAGISPDQLVSLKLDDITLKSALKLLLHSVRLTYVIEDDVVRITTEKHAHSKQKPHVYGCDEGELRGESYPKPKAEPGTEQQVRGLMKACRLLMNEGLHEQAAELARQAFALDPERVMADPLVYKMHLLATTPKKQPAGASEECEPPSCPYCPPIGKPIQGILPDKKKTDASSRERLLKETAEKVQARAGAEEACEEDGPSCLGELIEAMLGDSEHVQLGFGVNADGSLRLGGECTCFGSVYHILFNRGRLEIWTTPDAAKTQP